MEKVTLLGTAGAVTDRQRDNVSLVFSAQEAGEASVFHVLIECGGSAAHKLATLGIPYETLTDLIITHTHLDHLYGLPGLVFSIRYKDLDRTAALRIYCPEDAEQIIGALLDFFELREDLFFPIEIYGIPSQEDSLVLENAQVRITSTPVNHAPKIPTHAIKIFSKTSGKSVVYSSDTTYSEQLIRFAQGVDLLFHECAGLNGQPVPDVHSTALQVGKVAQQSNVKQLVLLHLDTALNNDPARILDEVHQHFTGHAVVGSDFDDYVL
ncbi:MBL fold metallo-hydrolase [candidate division KSB3 bacterium]|uniref:MBL fold metallo-hydrolase n=1 Tax=candidate division KSB3 bacterium TaxID=2044937 RepID=A0A9D5JSA6_9BACT|nr:MBL fold metallo-hydrolase [candidate division KSB3 bacterium]MBD3323342.1 MBL fold metallo-hydrolase [candidate division KSB3 bacterium]